MNFIVTGGAGFIGSHVVEKLLEAGHNVVVVDNLSTGFLHNLPKHPFLKLLQKDVLDCTPNDFSDLFSGSINGIAHLAAIPSVETSWQSPLKAHHSNLSATVAVLQLCRNLQIPRMVFASSAAVYGDPIELPIKEDNTTCPLSPYGLQKLMSEQYANLWRQAFGLTVISLRLFNVFGSRQLPNSPYSGVISIFTEAARRKRNIKIFGDGSQTRDFIHVTDVATAFTQALTINLESGVNLTCNVGTGQSLSILELVNALKSCFSAWNPTIFFDHERHGNIKHSIADISKVSSVLNFYPKRFLKADKNLLKVFSDLVSEGENLTN